MPDHLPPSELDRITGIVDTLYRKHTVDDPNLLPQSAIPDAAILAGTVGAIDRSAQYSHPDLARPEKLLTAVNAQGNHIRGLQSGQDELRERYNLQLRNTVISGLVGGAIARGPEIVEFLMRLLKLR